MKATGIVRRVDELGRVVLPIELRKVLHITEKDPLEIYTEGEQIVIKKYEPGCLFTGEMDNLIEYKGRLVSVTAVTEMARLAELIA